MNQVYVDNDAEPFDVPTIVGRIVIDRTEQGELKLQLYFTGKTEVHQTHYLTTQAVDMWIEAFRCERRATIYTTKGYIRIRKPDNQRIVLMLLFGSSDKTIVLNDSQCALFISDLKNFVDPEGQMQLDEEPLKLERMSRSERIQFNIMFAFILTLVAFMFAFGVISIAANELDYGFALGKMTSEYWAFLLVSFVGATVVNALLLDLK